jgi:hypothetical protein
MPPLDLRTRRHRRLLSLPALTHVEVAIGDHSAPAPAPRQDGRRRRRRCATTAPALDHRTAAVGAAANVDERRRPSRRRERCRPGQQDDLNAPRLPQPSTAGFQFQFVVLAIALRVRPSLSHVARRTFFFLRVTPYNVDVHTPTSMNTRTQTLPL